MTETNPIPIPLPDEAQVRARVEAMQQELARHNMDAALIMQPVDLYYYSRTSQFGMLAVPAEGRPALWIRKSLSRARGEAIFPCEPLPSFRHWPGMLRQASLNLDLVGLEMDVLPVAEFQRIQRAMPETQFVDISSIIRSLRSIKDDHEIACMRRAGHLIGRVFERIRHTLKPGIREADICAEIDGVLRRHGEPGVMRVRQWRAMLNPAVVSAGQSAAHPIAFDGPVGSAGSHAGLPCGPGTREVRPGEPLLIDLVASAGGYFADATRVFSLGPLDAPWVKAHTFCVQLMHDLAAGLKPGQSAGDLHRQALEAARDAGYEENFMNHGANQVRFVGHGIGLEVDEWPVVTERWQQPLQARQTLALEPKIIFPGGGVGVEDTFLIREHAQAESLIDFPQGIIQV